MILDEPMPQVRERPSSEFTHHETDAAGMTIAIATNDNHPLAGLSQQRRTQERIDAIALILARLALKSISKDEEASK